MPIPPDAPRPDAPTRPRLAAALLAPALLAPGLLAAAVGPVALAAPALGQSVQTADQVSTPDAPTTSPATAPASRPADETERDADGREVVRLNLAPVAAAEPALKVRLLPPAIDRTPGNGVPNLLIAIDGLSRRVDLVDPSDYFDVPLADFADALRSAGRAGSFERAAEFELDWIYDDSYWADLLDLAVRRERFDWDLPVREFGQRTLLPSLNDVRAAANWLGGRARLQLAADDVDGALRTMQTGFALSRSLGDRPLIITSLVQAGIGAFFLDRLKEVMAAPGAPNLYWALAELPRPYVDAADVIRSESEIVYASAPGLAEIERDPAAATVEQIRTAFRGLTAVDPATMKPVAEREPGWAESAGYAVIRARAAAFVTDEVGMPAARVAAMPAGQVVQLYWLLQFRRAVDAEHKWFLLPYPIAAPGVARADAARDADPGAVPFGIDVDNPLAPLMPTLLRARLTTALVDRNVALLMAVEAVRAHAAAHGGLPPATLGEVVDTPVLPDPVTGGPFGYDLDGRTFTLTADVPGEPQHSVKYVVTLAAE